MDETCVRIENGCRHISELKARLTGSQIELFDWEATEGDVGRFERKMMINV